MLFTLSKTEDSWPGLKPRSFSLECGAETGQGSNLEVLILNVIPAIDQATKLVCNSKSSMIDSLCVKMEIPLIGIPKNLP